METPSLGAGFSYSIQGAWSYLLQIGLDLRLFYWCGSTPITRKDQANMDYSRCKQILHDFYSENGIIDHFERDNLYLEKAFHEINEMWFRNLECIKEVKYLMIAEAPLWGKDKSYIYNPETKNTQFFQKKDLVFPSDDVQYVVVYPELPLKLYVLNIAINLPLLNIISVQLLVDLIPLRSLIFT